MERKKSKINIFTTQLLAIIFASIDEICVRKLICSDSRYFVMLTIALTVIYTIIISLILKRKSISLPLMCFSYIFYCAILSIIPYKFDSDVLYQVTRIILCFFQWIGVIVASLLNIDLEIE